MQTIVRIQRQRQLNGQTSRETAYYISSLPNDAARILRAVGRHWSIENSLHWVLDVTFADDDSRIRTDNGPQNMVILRQMALNVIKKDASKGSIRTNAIKPL